MPPARTLAKREVAVLRYRDRSNGCPRRWPVDAGAIVRIVEPQVLRHLDAAPRGTLRHPYIVESFEPRTYSAARRGPDGQWQDTRMSGGHLCTVRSLRDGRRRQVADWLVLACIEAGL